MNIKSWLLVVTAVCVGTGCATSQAPLKPTPATPAPKASRDYVDGDLAGFNPLLFSRPDKFRVNIVVDADEKLTIDQEPVRRSNSDAADVKLVWLLEQDPVGSPAKYVFPDDDAIHVTQMTGNATPMACGKESPKKFVCKYTRNGPATWKYTVRVTNNLTSIPLTKLDPQVHQE